MKITKIIDTEIRRVKTENGNVYAIIGQVKELIEKEIIYNDNTLGNEKKWLGIEENGNIIREFETLEEAKNYYRKIQLDEKSPSHLGRGNFYVICSFFVYDTIYFV